MSDISTITSVKWKDGSETDSEIEFSDGFKYDVPNDPENFHYIHIQEWIAGGNTIDAA